MVDDDPQRLLGHQRLLAALELWSWHGRFTNMATERLLSQIRRSAPLRCSVDRLLCAGMLTQIQHKHMRAGGKDVRKVTRSTLLNLGAPIAASRGRAARRKRMDSKPQLTSRVTAWINTRLVQRRLDTGQRLSRAQYLEEVASLRAEWGALSEEARHCASLEALRFRERQAYKNGAKAKSYAERIGNDCWHCSNESSPVSEALIQKCLDEVAPTTTTTRGLTAALEPVRQAFADTLVVRDEGAERQTTQGNRCRHCEICTLRPCT